jgi:prolyl-tRNA synthetase
MLSYRRTIALISAKNVLVKSRAQSQLVITKRSDNYSLWYADVINAADMIDQGAVRGCIVMKPLTMDIWDTIRNYLDKKIRDTGTKNVYFPMLIPMSYMSKEAAHVDGFAKECAVVTHHRLIANNDNTSLIPDPSAHLDEPLVIRPTSEATIWSSFHKWINSHRDLPLKVNQWANVMRYLTDSCIRVCP